MKKLTTAIAIAALFATGALFTAQDAQATDKKGPRHGKKEGKRPGFAQCDKDGDGVLSISEFAACYPRLGEARFKEIDTNNDGMINRDEMRVHRDKRRDERKRAFFEKCDTNKDGQLSFDEFNSCKPEKGPKGGKRAKK
ncbi:EF-hand domain-containing protein [Desulfovibrio sp. OttesenSCG-928-G15]|nr:EF-hand domain-containing protein [Desulfovibrio sp. OttesenSCG-928-G15]